MAERKGRVYESCFKQIVVSVFPVQKSVYRRVSIHVVGRSRDVAAELEKRVLAHKQLPLPVEYKARWTPQPAQRLSWYRIEILDVSFSASIPLPNHLCVNFFSLSRLHLPKLWRIFHTQAGAFDFVKKFHGQVGEGKHLFVKIQRNGALLERKGQKEQETNFLFSRLYESFPSKANLSSNREDKEFFSQQHTINSGIIIGEEGPSDSAIQEQKDPELPQCTDSHLHDGWIFTRFVPILASINVSEFCVFSQLGEDRRAHYEVIPEGSFVCQYGTFLDAWVDLITEWFASVCDVVCLWQESFATCTLTWNSVLSWTQRQMETGWQILLSRYWGLFSSSSVTNLAHQVSSNSQILWQTRGVSEQNCTRVSRVLVAHWLMFSQHITFWMHCDQVTQFHLNKEFGIAKSECDIVRLDSRWARTCWHLLLHQNIRAVCRFLSFDLLLHLWFDVSRFAVQMWNSASTWFFACRGQLSKTTWTQVRCWLHSDWHGNLEHRKKFRVHWI